MQPVRSNSPFISPAEEPPLAQAIEVTESGETVEGDEFKRQIEIALQQDTELTSQLNELSNMLNGLIEALGQTLGKIAKPCPNMGLLEMFKEAFGSLKTDTPEEEAELRGVVLKYLVKNSKAFKANIREALEAELEKQLEEAGCLNQRYFLQLKSRFDTFFDESASYVANQLFRRLSLSPELTVIEVVGVVGKEMNRRAMVISLDLLQELYVHPKFNRVQKNIIKQRMEKLECTLHMQKRALDHAVAKITEEFFTSKIKEFKNHIAAEEVISLPQRRRRKGKGRRNNDQIIAPSSSALRKEEKKTTPSPIAEVAESSSTAAAKKQNPSLIAEVLRQKPHKNHWRTTRKWGPIDPQKLRKNVGAEYDYADDKELLFQRACHYNPGLDKIIGHPLAAKVYTFCTERGVGLFCRLEHEERDEFGVVYYGIDKKNNVIFHRYFEPKIKEQLGDFKELTREKNSSPEAVEKDKEEGWTDTLPYQLTLKDNGKIAIIYDSIHGGHKLTLFPIRPELLNSSDLVNDL